jgi:hypothetical protein
MTAINSRNYMYDYIMTEFASKHAWRPATVLKFTHAYSTTIFFSTLELAY